MIGPENNNKRKINQGWEETKKIKVEEVLEEEVMVQEEPVEEDEQEDLLIEPDLERLMNFSDSDEDVEMDEKDDEVTVKLEAGDIKSEEKAEWEYSDTVPPGWMVKEVQAFGGRNTATYIKSPQGHVTIGRRLAVKHMMEANFSQEEVEAMQGMLEHEGWRKDPLLPPGWWCRQTRSAKNREFMLPDGGLLKGPRKVTEYLRETGASQEEITNLGIFLTDDLRMKQEEVDWMEDDTLPEGWKIRMMSNARCFLLSPAAELFVGKRLALRHMIRKGFPEEDIEKIKESMFQEGWIYHNLLPIGWLHRKIIAPNKAKGSSTFFISNEGDHFMSFKSAIEYVENNEFYNEQDAIKIKQLLQDISAQNRLEGNFADWKEDTNLPDGWKTRSNPNATNEKEWFLTQDGEQFHGRRLALQHMLRNGYNEEKISLMKESMKNDGWNSHKLLPTGWFFRQMLQKSRIKGKGTYGHVATYLITSDGECFYSFVRAIQFMNESDSYKSQDIQRLQDLMEDLAKKKRLEDRFETWKDNEDLPPGWKVKVMESKNKNIGFDKEFFLCPEGNSFHGAKKTMLHLIEKHYPEEELENMRRYMLKNGWETSENLPPKWIFKDRSSRSKSGIHTSINILANEGGHFESLNTAEEYLGFVTGYTEDDVRKLTLFGEELCTKRRTLHGEWKEVEGLPEGWMMRTVEVKEYYLTPKKEQISSMRLSLQYLIEQGAPESDIDTMKIFMLNHGWEASEHLPAGWVFKYSNDLKAFQAMSKEGQYFQSLLSIAKELTTNKNYGEEDVDRFSAFNKNFSKRRDGLLGVNLPKTAKVKYENGRVKDGLMSEGEAILASPENKKVKSDFSDVPLLPPGWRDGGSTTRDFIISPSGQQFTSRAKAIQHMIKNNGDPEDIAEMKRMTVHEGYQPHHLLPPGWIHRSAVSENIHRDHSNIRFLTTEGDILESFRKTGIYMKNSPNYGDADIERVMELMQTNVKERRKNRPPKTEAVQPGVTRKPEFARKVEFHITSDGSQFANKRLALKFLISDNYPEAEIEKLRGLMEEKDNWKRDHMLPEHWMYIKHQHASLVFVTNLGDVLSGVQAAQNLIEAQYKPDIVANFKNFTDIQAVISRSNRYVWREDDTTVPEGWKSRKTGTKEYILSPDGHQFCSRKQGLLYMIKEGFEQEELEEMRRMMECEGWEKSEFLPEGWIIQNSWTLYKADHKLSFQIMSPLGEVFDSYRTVTNFMKKSSDFGQEDINKINKLIAFNLNRQKSTAPKVKQDQEWKEDDSLPKGWKVRRSGSSGAQTEIFLTSQGQQIVSLPSALEHVVKHGYSEADIAMVRQGLKRFGWEEDPSLPSGYLSKVKEGRTYYYTPSNERLEGAASLLEDLLERGFPFLVTGPVARRVEWPRLALDRRTSLQKRVHTQILQEEQI